MVEVQLEPLRRPDLAFDFAERSRARVLLDLLADLDRRPDPNGSAAAAGAERLAAVTREPLTSAVVRRRLPAGTVLVEYALLEHRSVAFVIAAGTLDAVALPATPRAVAEAAARLVAGLRHRADDADTS